MDTHFSKAKKENFIKPKIDINKLAGHFARTPFQVEAVYRGVRGPDTAEEGVSTEEFPGFMFPLRGKAEFCFDGVPYVAYKGKVLHGGAQMKLDKKVIGKDRWEYLLVQYSICGSEPDNFSLYSTHFELMVGQSAGITELLERLWSVSSQPGGIPAFQTETLFRNVLEEVFTAARNVKNEGMQGSFEQISSYIHEHYMDTISISKLAEQNGLNRNGLAYIFYKYAGMGPGDYLLRYRLNRAKELLLTSDGLIREIAHATGFNDSFYFSKAFKKQFGLSPSEFRK